MVKSTDPKFKKEREETEKSLYFKDFYWYKKIARAIFHSILNFEEKDNESYDNIFLVFKH